MPYLTSVRIKFDTHDDNKDGDTSVSVFVKNRLSNSLSGEGNRDFISNWLAFQRYQDPNDLGDGRQNPFLAYGIALQREYSIGVDYGDPQEFDDPSSLEYELTLTSDTITLDEIVLPTVDVHILANGNDRWIFDYTVTLTFDGHIRFSFSSNTDGVRGIILDQDNRNHYGLGVERGSTPFFPKALTDSVLKRVTLDFHTHNDNKDWDTRLNVHIVNRVSEHIAQDLAIGLDLFHDEEFPDSGPTADSLKSVSWSADELPLPSAGIRLADIVLPVVNIIIGPNGNDRWIFDYRVTFEFGSPEDFAGKQLKYSSQTSGVILDQDNNKHSGAYHGRPFPTVSPPTAPPLTSQPVDHTTPNAKSVSIAFLQKKFEEIINTRNGADTSDNPPLNRVVLSSESGNAYPALPESYLDRRAITAGKVSPSASYVSNPISIGQQYNALGLADTTLNEITSDHLQLTVDADPVTPVSLRIDFAPFNPDDGSGSFDVDVLGIARIQEFWITLRLTLDLKHTVLASAATQTVVDVMSWVDELRDMHITIVNSGNSPPVYHYSGSFLHEPVDLISPLSIYDLFVEQVVKVHLQTGSVTDPGGIIRKKIRDKIFDELVSLDPFTNRSRRDGINSMVTSWLVGGVADDDHNTDENNAWIEDISIKKADPALGPAEDSIVISYRGPRNVFVPQQPADWPKPGQPNPAHDFSPGRLANIDHIIVLMKENRSFDHLLGYLSLPEERGGMGRQDVDGLTGDEVNTYNGTDYHPFELHDTRFAPGPPNDYESVRRAINNGHMDGFVRSQADAYGAAAAGRVMGYHTGETVPQFDALARDFTIGHRWFSSHPGPTFPNRFYELTGRPNLDAHGFWELENSNPILPSFTPTIFEYLDGAVDPRSGAQYTWRYFEHAYCALRFFEKHTFNHTNIVDVTDPEDGFFARAASGQLPNVSFIDPHFLDYPPDSNCDEPPSDIANGQDLVQRIVEAVVTSPAWNKTLLLIVYDEHGGFYDHVPPSPAPRVSPELPINTLGVRVPAIVISPWVAAGAVFGHDGVLVDGTGDTKKRAAETAVAARARDNFHFDHTSILKTIARRFLSRNPPYMGARFAAAHDLSEVIGNELRQPQFLPFIRYRLQFVQSRMLLTVRDHNRTAGTELVQANFDGTIASDFSFEDAGDGFVYIRSHVGNLYVSVDDGELTPDGTATAYAAPEETSANTPTSAEPDTGAPAAPVPPRIIQDRKYPPTSATVVSTKRAALQKWRLSPVSATVLDRDLYVISNQAYPTLFLRPSRPTPHSPLILSINAGGTGGVHRLPQYAWRVTSPAFPSPSIVSNPIATAD